MHTKKSDQTLNINSSNTEADMNVSDSRVGFSY